MSIAFVVIVHYFADSFDMHASSGRNSDSVKTVYLTQGCISNRIYVWVNCGLFGCCGRKTAVIGIWDAS